MPKLTNERHELYALQRAKGFPPSKAGQVAGFATGSSSISEIEKDPVVRARIDELIAELRDRREATRYAAIEAAKVIGQVEGMGKAWVIRKLSENASLAMSADDFRAANESLKLIGEEFGMFKGNSAADPDAGFSDQPLNLDVYEEVLGKQVVDTAIESFPAGEDVPFPEISDDALALIEGQSEHAKQMIKARRSRTLSTGSETDVALDGRTDLEDDRDPLDEPLEDDGDDAPMAALQEMRNITPAAPANDRPPRRSQQASHQPLKPRRGRG